MTPNFDPGQASAASVALACAWDFVRLFAIAALGSLGVVALVRRWLDR